MAVADDWILQGSGSTNASVPACSVGDVGDTPLQNAQSVTHNPNATQEDKDAEQTMIDASNNAKGVFYDPNATLQQKDIAQRTVDAMCGQNTNTDTGGAGSAAVGTVGAIFAGVAAVSATKTANGGSDSVVSGGNFDLGNSSTDAYGNTIDHGRSEISGVGEQKLGIDTALTNAGVEEDVTGMLERDTLKAVGNIETDNYQMNYPIVDNKYGDSTNYGIYKINEKQIRETGYTGNLRDINNDNDLATKIAHDSYQQNGRENFLAEHRGGESALGNQGIQDIMILPITKMKLMK